MFYQTFALSLVLILGSWTFCKCSTFKYAVLIDAGSSGSRVKVYQMSVNEHGKVTGPQDVTPIKAPNGEIEPGLSSFANNPSGIEDYLKKLIDSAKSAVPADAYATTPILLMATAGMRLLTQQQQQSVMAEVRRIFSDKSVSPFKFSDENARIISGMDEAVYAWITVNFLNGAFTKRDAKTHGILEIGGASVQVSYHPFHRHFTTTVKLGGTKYRLYAKSYLGYGINEVADRFNEYVGKVTGGDGTFRSPCHHSGYETNFQIDGKEVHLVGAPNFRRCKKIMDSLFFCADKNKPCPFENQPPLKKAFRDFYAISAFYYVLKDIGALKNSPLVTVRAIRRAAKKYCREKYDDINKSKYAKRNCLAAVYIHELMMKGFKANNKFKVNGVKEIGGEQLGWVLGGLVYNMKIV